MTLNDPNDPSSLSFQFRARRAILLREKMLRAGRRILDLGGTANYWHRVGLDFLTNHGFEITIVNHVGSELGEGPFRLLVADACSLDLPDHSFDLVHSNSVIEHVGSWDRMQMFAREIRRLAPAYYVQTPNWWFPIDPHFYRLPYFHWFSPNMRAKLLHYFPVAPSGRVATMERAREVVAGTQLLTAAQMKSLFPDAHLVKERMLGLAKSLTAIRDP